MIKVSKRPENLQTVKRKSDVATSLRMSVCRRAIERAQKTLRHVQWFEVKEQRGRILADGIEYQVTVEIGFTLES